MFKTILNANKDLEDGILYLSYQGLLKLEFKSENTTSTYYMIRKEESAFWYVLTNNIVARAQVMFL